MLLLKLNPLLLMEKTALKSLKIKTRMNITPDLNAAVKIHAAWHACQERVPRRPTRMSNRRKFALIKQRPKYQSCIKPPLQRLLTNAWKLTKTRKLPNYNAVNLVFAQIKKIQVLSA